MHGLIVSAFAVSLYWTRERDGVAVNLHSPSCRATPCPWPPWWPCCGTGLRRTVRKAAQSFSTCGYGWPWMPAVDGARSRGRALNTDSPCLTAAICPSARNPLEDKTLFNHPFLVHRLCFILEHVGAKHMLVLALPCS